MLGIVLADRGWLRAEAGLVLAASGLALGVLARRPGWRAGWAVVACVGAGALALGLRLEAAQRGRPGPAGRECSVEASVARVVHRSSGTRLLLERAAALEAEPVPRRIELLLEPAGPGEAGLARALPGERIRARLRLRAPGFRHNPGSLRSRRDPMRRGVGALARLVDPALSVRLPEREGWRPLAPLWRLRRDLSEGLAARGPAAGLLAALVLGDRRGVSPRSLDAFAALGLSHLLAVSGLHVGLVAGAVLLVLGSVGPRIPGLASRLDTRRLAIAGALLAATLYAPLAGASLPVRRALVFAWALGLSRLMARPTRRSQPLVAAAAIVLIHTPEALFEAGAQLSFAACAAFLLARPSPARTAERPGPAWLAAWEASLRTTATALIATAPIAAHRLGVGTPLALLANAVAVPWTALVLLPSGLLAVAAEAAGAGAGPLLLPGQLTLWAAEGLAEWAHRSLPTRGHVVTPPAPGWLGAAALLGGLALTRPGTAVRVVGALAVTGLLAWAPPRSLAPPAPRLVALDVGQGTAVLLQARRAAVLVDAGTAVPGGVDLGRRSVVPALAALGVDRLDLLAVSHADLDHRGGVPAVLDSLPVAELWLPYGGRADPAFAAVLAAAARARVPVVETGAGAPERRLGGLRVAALWPPREPGPPAPGHRNDRSLVLRLEVAGRRVLLPGDLEQSGERALIDRGAELGADVLLLPHHGSRSSSSRAFLAAVRAQVAIASAPRAGRFGMPHPEVSARAAAAGAALWWTGRDGAVAVALAPGRPLWVRGFGDGER